MEILSSHNIQKKLPLSQNIYEIVIYNFTYDKNRKNHHTKYITHIFYEYNKGSIRKTSNLSSLFKNNPFSVNIGEILT